MAEKGNLSIHSENMFPIIKKWLYSDQDIFVRELISNGCDAITKLKKLDAVGEFSLPEGYVPRIDVIADPAEKTLTFSDNGIGMTADEVREYINNIAFSGAADFLEKYKDKAGADQIIGHFGLGFYSAFMVSELVEIDTLSYTEGARPVHWSCDGSSEYSMEDGTRATFGTTITLHLSEDCLAYSNYYRAKEVIEKYCAFMPTEIYLSEKDSGETQIIGASDRLPSDTVIEELPQETREGEEPGEARLKIRKRPELMNDIHPLWGKTPADCTEEEYKAFYRKVFMDYKEPLFWIHLNMDYPFNLKGILYFPRINMEYESIEGVIKLYNNQVFIADNIKEVIPEFLMLLKGVIDCPDLPLNVSRSALQNDGFVQKISEYITRKVAEKLVGMCKTDRENYEKYWDDIAPFVKYGCLRDDKFCQKMTDSILFKDLDGNYVALPDALEINRGAGEDVDEAEQSEDAKGAEGKASETESEPETEAEEPAPDRTIYYVTDARQQSQYIAMFKDAGMKAFLLEHAIDQPFISQLEAKNEGVHFARIDADVQSALLGRTGKKTAKELEEKAKELTDAFRAALGEEHLVVELKKLKNKKLSSVLTVDEQSRRMQDMMKMYASGSGMSLKDLGLGADGAKLVLNANHPLVKYICEHGDAGHGKLIMKQLYDLARLANAPLPAEAMTEFLDRSNEIMMLMSEKDAE